MRYANAVIRWKARPGIMGVWPPINYYIGRVKFEADKDDWPDRCWNVVTHCQEIESELVWRAAIHFLAADGPEHLLCPGARFEIYEIWNVIAAGEVTEIIDHIQLVQWPVK